MEFKDLTKNIFLFYYLKCVWLKSGDDEVV